MKSANLMLVLLAFVLMFVNCENQITDPEGASGSAQVTIVLKEIGQLSKISTINLNKLYIVMTSGTEIVHDSIAVSGSSQTIVSKTYDNLKLGEWSLSAESKDENGITIHNGSTTFTVEAYTTTDVSLDLTAGYSMLTANFIGITDSVSYLELLVDAGKVADTTFAQGSESGNTVSLEYDYLETGKTHTILLNAYGSMFGIYQLQYTGDTTISVVAGVDTSFTVNLDYVGLTEAPKGAASVTITIGKSGRVTVNGELIKYITGTVTDVDGNVYKTVKIGNQWWMAENLKVTHYRNGDALSKVTDSGSWYALSSGGYCNYNNDDNNIETYGYLYNWYAVNDSRELAPAGWHIPTDAEWTQLTDYVGVGSRDKLKSTSGWNNNLNGTNEYGFDALPGGMRTFTGTYGYLGWGAYFWSATYESISNGWYRNWAENNTEVVRIAGPKEHGLSIRCVMD